MKSEVGKVSDARVQSLGLKFSFITQSQKLIIEALCSKDGLRYVGQIIKNPYIDFDDIKEMLEQGQFKTISKTDDVLKIKVGATPIQMICKQKLQIKQLEQKVNKSIEKQAELQELIEAQKIKIKEMSISISGMKVTISDMKDTIESMKQVPKESINQPDIYSLYQQLKQDYVMRIRDCRSYLTLQISQIQSNDINQSFQRKFRTLSMTVREGFDEFNLIHDDLYKQIDQIKQTQTNQLTLIKTQIQSNTSKIAQVQQMKNKVDQIQSQMEQLQNKIIQSFNCPINQKTAQIKQPSQKLFDKKTQNLLSLLKNRNQRPSVESISAQQQKQKSKNLANQNKMEKIYLSKCQPNRKFEKNPS